MNKQCKTCPFLEVNRGKPTPTDFKCVEQNQTDWYSQENLDGVWDHMRRNPIEFLSCHSTDPDYYGKEGGKIFACIGAALGVYMHIKIYEKVGANYNNYVKVVGRDVAMTLKAMGEKAFAIALGRTSPLFAGMYLPRDLKLELDEVRWPTGFKNTVKEFEKILKKEKA